VIVPQGRQKVIDELHAAHPGISRMKSLACSYVWWPGMNEQVEGKVKNCRLCQEMSKNPPAVPMQSWEWPTKPWSRLHIDYDDPFQGKIFHVVVDAHSKWMEVSIVNSSNTAITIQKLRSMFATHCYQRQLFLIMVVFLPAVNLRISYRRKEYVTSELLLTTHYQMG